MSFFVRVSPCRASDLDLELSPVSSGLRRCCRAASSRSIVAEMLQTELAIENALALRVVRLDAAYEVRRGLAQRLHQPVELGAELATERLALLRLCRAFVRGLKNLRDERIRGGLAR